MPWLLSPLDERDLEEIWLYVAEDASPATANRLIDANRRPIRSTGEQPRMGRLGPELGTDVDRSQLKVAFNRAGTLSAMRKERRSKHEPRTTLRLRTELGMDRWGRRLKAPAATQNQRPGSERTANCEGLRLRSKGDIGDLIASRPLCASRPARRAARPA